MANASPEPSMDDILASIRRIISEDDDAPEAASSAAADDAPLDLGAEAEVAGDTPGDDADGQAALGEGPMVPNSIEDDLDSPDFAAAAPTVTPFPAAGEGDAADDVLATAKESEPDMPRTEPAPETDRVADERPRPRAAADASVTAAATEAVGALVSNTVVSKASEMFGGLEASVRIANQQSRTMEDIVEAMLRPMLKEWLDDHLPRIVQEKVDEEVRRIARRH